MADGRQQQDQPPPRRGSRPSLQPYQPRRYQQQPHDSDASGTGSRRTPPGAGSNGRRQQGQAAGRHTAGGAALHAGATAQQAAPAAAAAPLTVDALVAAAGDSRKPSVRHFSPCYPAKCPLQHAPVPPCWASSSTPNPSPCRLREPPPWHSCTSNCLKHWHSVKPCSSCRCFGRVCWSYSCKTPHLRLLRQRRQLWVPLGHLPHRPLPQQLQLGRPAAAGPRLPHQPGAAQLGAWCSTGCCRCYSGGLHPRATRWRHISWRQRCWHFEIVWQVGWAPCCVNFDCLHCILCA